MSVLDRVRSVPTSAEGGTSIWRRRQTVLDGVLAAGVPWLICVLVGLLAWLGTPHESVGAAAAIGVSGAAWLLASGASISASTVPVSMVPLGLWGLSIWWTRRRLRAALVRTRRDVPDGPWPGGQVLGQLGIGYAVPVALASLASLAGPARPTVIGLVTAFSVPIAAAVVQAVAEVHRGESLVVSDAWAERLPLWLRRGLVPGAEAAGVLGAVGLLVVVAALTLRYDVVLGLHGALSPGVVGGAVLTLGQVLYLPNLAVWAVSLLAGPGFQVAAGSTITVNGAAPGLLPMVPVLGALPTEGTYPRTIAVVLAVPVLVGVFLGWRVCRQWARLAAWREKARSTLTGVVTATLAIGGAAAMGSGAAGSERLAHIGVPVVWLMAALFGELALGAALYLAGDLFVRRLGR